MRRFGTDSDLAKPEPCLLANVYDFPDAQQLFKWREVTGKAHCAGEPVKRQLFLLAVGIPRGLELA